MQFELDSYSNYDFSLPLVGDRIDDNIIIELIAEGGMACVYKVKNEALEVVRVVKVMKTSSDVDADRFVTEARISANLNHPNIVQCYRFSKYKKTIPFIEMEYVDGINLYQLIADRNKIPPPVSAAIIHYICKALEALHSCQYTLYGKERHGVVHRDIKPANILISKLGMVKLADFGIAKPRDLSKHTSAVHVIGSSFYISPEQFKKKELDFPADIYSLGCVIFEMMTGCKAFDYDNLSDLVMAKMHNNYNKALLYDCPDNFITIISKCIQFNEDDRYSSIRELSDEIDLILEEYSIEDPQYVIRDYIDHPDTLSFSINSGTKKKRFLPVMLLSASVLLCVLVLLALYLVKQPYEEKVEPKTIVEEVKKKSQEAPLQSKSKATVADSKKRPVVKKVEKQIPNQPKAIPNEQKPSEPALPKQVKNDSQLQIVDAFIRGEFNPIITSLSDATIENDTHALCYLGSLLETGKMNKLELLLSEYDIQDGYFDYLKGRVYYSKRNYEKATTHFASAATKSSFYWKKPHVLAYFHAKLATTVFLEKPNSANKNSMLKAQKIFISKYCSSRDSKECRDIKTSYEKYK